MARRHVLRRLLARADPSLFGDSVCVFVSVTIWTGGRLEVPEFRVCTIRPAPAPVKNRLIWAEPAAEVPSALASPTVQLVAPSPLKKKPRLPWTSSSGIRVN